MATIDKKLLEQAQAQQAQAELEKQKLALKAEEARGKLALDARKLAMEERKAG